MSVLELSLSLMTGAVSAGGAWWWVRNHTHPELVSRVELMQLELRLDAILIELRYLRQRLDRQADKG